MADVFDSVQASPPQGDVFDQVGTSTRGYWGDVMHNLIPAAASDLADVVSAPVQKIQELFGGANPPPLTPIKVPSLKEEASGYLNTIKNIPNAFRQDPLGVIGKAALNAAPLVAGVIGETPTEEDIATGRAQEGFNEPPTNQSIKKLTEAVQPTKVPQFQQGASTAIPALKEFESTTGPITLKNWKAAQQLAETKRDNAANTFLDAARAGEQTVDGNAIANAKIDAIPSAWRTDPRYRGQYEAAINDANTFRGRQMSIDDAMGELQNLNAQVGRYHQMTPDQQFAADLAGKPIADLESEAQGYRNAISQAVDPEHNGQQFQQLQRERRDLINFRQNMEGMENKLQKQYTPTTAQSLITKGSDVLGVFQGKGGEILSRNMRQAPELDKMVSDAFANYKGPDLPQTPFHVKVTPKQTLPSSPDMLRHDPLGMSHPGPSAPSIFDRPAGSQDPLGMNSRQPFTVNIGDLRHDPLGMTHVPPTSPSGFGATPARNSPDFYPSELDSGQYPTKQGELFNQTPTFPVRNDLSDRLKSVMDIIMNRKD